jgi:chitinase
MERRLSPWRVALALLILGVVVAGVFLGTRQWQDSRAAASRKPWFASYVDVTATPTFAFEQLGSSATRDAVLSFIVSSPTDACTPTWGGAYTMDQANSSLDLERRIARLKQQDGSVAISFGGLKNDELAVKCTDHDELKQAYLSVIERYDIDTIDLDLELQGLTDSEAADRRAKVIAEIQKERRAKGKNLAVWATLPVAPQGLTIDGTNAISQLLEGGVDLTGVNVMTMDYGGSLEKGQSMLDGSKNALINTHRQLGILYQRAGIQLSSATIWSKLGATPMIGQNDVPEEIFSLEDAKGLNEFVRSKNMGRMSMWSANRDGQCGGNYVDTQVVSDSCSGIEQDKQDFAITLSEGFEGSISSSAGLVTTDEPESNNVQEPDDPKSSPYQIWYAEGAYLEGTKVVWHHNVYEAKWWTQGDMPDNPVLQTWETPWQLIGPVLPGEKPIPQATLPAGTYPEWSGATTYDTRQRVLFDGVPYQAKWWNKGESPAAASSKADTSPWAPLTQEQINKLKLAN